MRKIFITGTDTGIGKTYATTQLIKHLNHEGYCTIALKPLASGCMQTNKGLRNEDALLLQKTASMSLTYETVNPFAFEPPIAPHLAAKLQGQTLYAREITLACDLSQYQADFALIEGVGGWDVPLNSSETMADCVQLLGAEVILIIGMRLGCLNHAILTAKAIVESGCSFLGWVANCINPDMPYLNENIETLQNLLAAPMIGTIPYQESLRLKIPSFFDGSVSC